VSGALIPRVGETFGEYTIEAQLGRGGMGTVYLATHGRLGRRVALKLLAPDLAHDEAFRARFLRESRLAASLDHPNVIPIYDANEIDGVLFLAMRYVSGPSLQALVRERGPLTVGETSRIVDQVGGALDAAHRAGLVHRDVKPANVLVAEPEQHVYLCDFGLAKQASSAGTTQTGFFLGTLDFAAPEQIEGKQIDARTDVYALGGVVHYCLTGEPPYVRDGDVALLQAHLNDPPPAPSRVRADVPGPVDAVLAQAMAKAPAARYATAGALASDLRRAAAGEDVRVDDEVTRAAPTVQTPTPTRPRRRRYARLIALLAVALAVAAGLVIFFATRNGGNTQDEKLRTFVDRIENVLAQSSEGRREIASALTARSNCAISAREAGQRIASVADNRQSILEQLGVQQTPTPQADQVVTLLQQALQQSIEADRHYRDALVAAPPNRCALPDNASFRLAQASNARATATKRRFVARFNPLAQRFDRRTWSAGEI
jgi:serine/threonine protein kinase